MFLSSYVTDFTTFSSLYCVMFSITNGMVYINSIVVTWSYFPENKGLVTGILMAAYGTSSSIYNLICTTLLNPENESPMILGENQHMYFHPEIANRVPSMLQTISLIYLTLGILGSLLISNVKPDIQSKDYIPFKSILKSRVFLILLSTAFFASCNLYSAYGLYIPGAFKNFGLTKFKDDHFISAAGAIGGILNGCCRILWSVLVDVTNFRSLFYIILFSQLILSSTIYLFTVNKWIYMIYIVLSFICEGTYFAMYPLVCCKIFGEK